MSEVWCESEAKEHLYSVGHVDSVVLLLVIDHPCNNVSDAFQIESGIMDINNCSHPRGLLASASDSLHPRESMIGKNLGSSLSINCSHCESTIRGRKGTMQGAELMECHIYNLTRVEKVNGGRVEMKDVDEVGGMYVFISFLILNPRPPLVTSLSPSGVPL